MVHIFNWACINYIRVQQLFFFILWHRNSYLCYCQKTLSTIRYSKSCILYHITYTTIGALLYQPLRFILTLNSNRSMISFGRKHRKYDMHIYFHASFHLPQRRFCRIYLSTKTSPHDPQNLLLAQTNRPMKTPGRIFFDNPFLPIRLNVAVYRHLIYTDH